jgi:ribosomal-protein-alanine N-acetyltransferase
MPELHLLRVDHAAAILDFETTNRAYFAASISDRGDEFFERFADVHRARLAEQEAGTGAYYVLLAEDGSVLGRFNLILGEEGVADLGYRVAQRVTGHGVATASVRDLCGIAASRHGVSILRAATSHANLASQRVLLKAGFLPVGPADPAEIGGEQGTRYEREVGPRSERPTRPGSP